MKVAICDCTAIWLKEGKSLLENSGNEVRTMHFTDRPFAMELEQDSLNANEEELIQWCDALLIGRDLTSKAMSYRFIIMAREKLPTLPIVVWSGGWESDEWGTRLRLGYIKKPKRNRNEDFIKDFMLQVNEQQITLSGSGELFAAAAIHDEGGGSEGGEGAKSRIRRLQQLEEMTHIDEEGYAPADGRHSWGWYHSRDWGVTKHEMGHAFCDGNLTRDDIAKFLPEMKRILERAYKAMPEDFEEDTRFKPCAEFILAGADPDEFQLVSY